MATIRIGVIGGDVYSEPSSGGSGAWLGSFLLRRFLLRRSATADDQGLLARQFSRL